MWKNLFKKKKKGLTLIEALIVIMFLGIISSIAIPKFILSKADSETKACKFNLRIIQDSVMHYRFTEGQNPTNLDDLLNKGYFRIYTEPKCPGGGSYYIENGVAKCTQEGHTLDN